jgi:hypothetical protein
VLKARQVESGIVASEQEIEVESIGASQTARPGSDLVVPTQYNYYLDAILYNDGVIVDTARAGATLDPTERVPENDTEREVELDVGDFDSDDDVYDPDEDSAADTGGDDGADAPSSDDGGPGFGVAVALLATVLGLSLRARTDVS